ncbi:isoamylase early set domain-containing protein [Micromonospora sp. NPDC023966]|uniref:isoamylase early set domain-containing protein n=1 Tax=Micromonospora sp. NPDC023966 TaxID=3154699 RepID=UPI0033C835C1
MIKRNKLFGNQIRVTFCLPRDTPPGTVSVVGCFNDWQPGRHELVARRDGTRTVTVRLGPGEYRFRYLATGGVWLDDESADQVDERGGTLRL